MRFHLNTMEWIQEDDTSDGDEGRTTEYEEEDEVEEDEAMKMFRLSPLGALLEDDEQEGVGEEDDDFYGERMSTVTVTTEYEPDADEEDMLEQLLPMEIHPRHAAVIYRYYTPEERSKRGERHKQIDRLLGPVGRPKIVKDDAYYALYESDNDEGLETPTQVDRSLAGRDPERSALTLEEEAFSKPRVPTPLLHARLLAMNPTPALTEMSLDEHLKNYVAWRKEVKRQGGEHRPRDPPPLQDPGNKIECEQDFRFKPGDVFLFLERRTKNEPPPTLQSYVNIHKDMSYFEDHGQYRLNFMDIYGPVFDGDMVVRFGNFNKYWRWNPHGTITFYVYFNEVKPSENCTAPHPWYSIEQFRLPQKGKYPRNNSIFEPVAENTPLGEIMPDFQLCDGDILMTYIWDTQAPRFDRMKMYVWNPLLANIGVDRFVNDNDRVLRHHVTYHKVPYIDISGQQRNSEVAQIQAELYCFLKSPARVGDWFFMGRSEEWFLDHFLHRKLKIGKVKATVQVPLAGDIIFDRGLKFTLDHNPEKRGGPTKVWFKRLNIGGLVSFHTWEMLKDWGREARPFVRFTDVGKYGVGSTTMALRFGTFKEPKGAPESSTWTWRDRKQVELFLLNTRGSSWRRVTVANWPENFRPKPNYNWEPYNENEVSQVPPWFEPRFGDIVIRLWTDHLWVSHKSNPMLVGNTYNSHYDVDIQMGVWGPDLKDLKKGDFLVRAGYEKNDINPSWTNATVELYYHAGEDNAASPWEFWGRDAYVFGTNYIFGGLKGVEQGGFGKMSMYEIEKLNRFDRNKFVKLDPSEIWKEKTRTEALRDPQPYCSH